ncbi:MAG: hypothetical protein NW226_08905 [Microscillaceae bacterium]|nr:hypothetical protein [Microscillaceae bacterium]
MGYQKVYLKTINGFFDFDMRRYKTDSGLKTWLDLTQVYSLGRGYESPLLQAYYLEWSKYLSYEKVSDLLETRIGNGRLSDQHIFNKVSAYAAEIATFQSSQIKSWEDAQISEIMGESVDIYEEKSKEVLFYSDGVGVGEQKQKRDKIAKEGKERTNINIMMLQIPSKTATATFETMIAGEGIDEVKLAKSVLHTHYQGLSSLPVVCISDGATCLKNQNKAIFGQNVRHILDWYHLSAKIKQLMSQIASNKAIKEEMIALLLNYLWQGKTITALIALKFLVPKNKVKHQELIGYLEKNEAYIIDYERRQKAGKSIGSGRMEKQNDLIVAKRQKRKGMAWSAKGARNLAIVTAYHKYSA